MNRKFLKKAVAALLSLGLAVSITACGGNNSQSSDAQEPKVQDSASAPSDTEKESLRKITFLLDWTPNTNHTGVYAAQKLGYYQEAGLDVTIVEGSGESVTALVGTGKGEFGVDFQDSMAPALTSGVPVTAVAAILQHNTSGIVSMKGKGIDRPKGMEGKSYATWDLPVEKATLKYVIEKDGGDFSKVNLIPNTVTDVLTALQTDVDAVWIFYGWDGIATEVKGLETDYFAFKDIDPVFDYYTPVILANNDFLKTNPDTAKAFLAATEKGYRYCMEHPEEAAQILLDSASGLDADIVKASQKWLADQYIGDAAQWGYIDAGRWDAFYQWLWDNQLLEKEIPAGTGFDNSYLSGGAQ